MDRPSVESALQGQPRVGGRFEWLDDSTVRFITDQPFPTGAEIQLTFAASARAANGQALTEPVTLHFLVADSLHVTERLPKPGSADANPSSAVVVTFNIPGRGPGRGPRLAAAGVHPPAPGRRPRRVAQHLHLHLLPRAGPGGRRALHRHPRPRLEKRRAACRSAWQGLDPQDWTFYHRPAGRHRLSFGDADRLELDGKITLTFNQPMDTASVRAGPGPARPRPARPVPLKYTWDERGTQ